MSKFQSLKQYIDLESGPKRFIPVGTSDIEETEHDLGFLLPAGLKAFYKEIGYGWYRDDIRSDLRNLIIPPLEIVELYNNRSEFGPPEVFLKGDLPIFDCGWNMFLVTRPFSSDPEKIYRDDGKEESIANNFADFIAKLMDNVAFYEL